MKRESGLSAKRGGGGAELSEVMPQLKPSLKRLDASGKRHSESRRNLVEGTELEFAKECSGWRLQQSEYP